MLKRDVFMNAMKLGRYGDLAWLTTAFAVSKPAADWGAHAKLGDIFQNDVSHYVQTEEGLVAIEDSVPKRPLFHFLEELDITAADCPNVRQETLHTCYGNLLVNWIVMVHSFGAKLPYQSGMILPDKIEPLILRNFQDDPEDGVRLDNTIYVSEYKKYADAMYFLTGTTQLCVWAATKKTLLPPPGLVEFRNKLLEKHAGHLTELATIAEIDKELVAFDAAYLKGDPGGDNFVSDGKSRNIVRKKKFLMHGAEVGLNESTVHGVLVVNSLHEGWDITKFADMNNSLRSGSFNRGAQTMLGGVSVKWLLRASANTNVTLGDCGSKLGSYTEITQSNASKYLGFTLINDAGEQEHVGDMETMGKYLGKTLMVRNPMYCKLPYTDYCKVCVGDRLAVNPTGLSVAVSDYGSTFLGLFMSAMHGKQLKTAKMNLDTAII